MNLANFFVVGGLLLLAVVTMPYGLAIIAGLVCVWSRS